MRARLLEHLQGASLGGGVRVHGPRDPLLRLPNTLSIGIPGLQARVLLDTVSSGNRLSLRDLRYTPAAFRAGGGGVVVAVCVPLRH